MSPTTADLRDALSRSAEPGPRSSERLVGVRRLVARRRRQRAAGSAVVALAVVGAVFAVTQPSRPQPAPPATSRMVGLPTYAQGGRLLGQAQLTAKVGDERTFDITPTGYELTVVTSCTGSPSQLIDVVVQINGRGVTWGGCGTIGSGPFEDGGRFWKQFGVTPGQPATVSVRIGPSDRQAGAQDADSAAIPVSAGVYQAVPPEQYPLPPRPALVTPPPDDDRVRNSSTPQRDVVRIEPGPAATGRLTRTLTYHPDVVGEVRTWAPGLVRLLVNGKSFSGTATWTYSPSDYGFDLTPAALREVGIAVPRDGEPVTLTVVTERFQDPAWRLEVGRP